MLRGSRSRFGCERCDEDIARRTEEGDIHPALPLWGAGRAESSAALVAEQRATLADNTALCGFLESAGPALAYRPARLMADDFCWQFCDDDALQLRFSLPRGGFATAVLRELVKYDDTSINRGEQRGG